MARDTAPQLIDYQALADDVTTPRSLPSVSWQTGDLITVLAGDEGASAGEVPGVANQLGLTFGSSTITAASCAAGGVWTAAASGNSSGAIAVTDTPGWNWAAAVWVWRGTDGLGQRFVTASPGSARTISVTPTDTHSAYIWALYDWNTNSYTGAAFTPTPTHSRNLGTQYPDRYTYSVADLTDMAGSSPTSFGLTATAPSAGVFTIVGAEILGTTAGGGGDPMVMVNMASRRMSE